MRKSISKILTDSLLIIFSVLLALIINEWRNNYDTNKETKTIINNLKAEIQSNQSYVLESAGYHKQVIDRIYDVVEEGEIAATFVGEDNYVGLYKVAPKPLIQGKPSAIAWEVAKQAKISNRIPLDQVRVLYGIYEHQNSILQTSDRLIAYISERETQRLELLEESILIISAEIEELYAQEIYLLSKYEEGLEALN